MEPPNYGQSGPMGQPPSGPMGQPPAYGQTGPMGQPPTGPMGQPGTGPMGQGAYMATPVVVVQQRNKGLAIALEVIGGLFGIFGIGWLVSGITNVGLILLISGIVWFLIEVVIITLTIGFGVLCTVPIDIAVLVTSTILLNNRLKAMPGV